MLEVKVIGAGLAGCEAAWQLAERGIHVTLTEMKPHKMTPAHHCADFAELVCSNSLRGDRLENAVGLLKEELRRLNSLILSCAEANRETAIGALAAYISDESVVSFQPMNVNFGILTPLDHRVKGKANKNLAIAQRSLALIDQMTGQEEAT